MQRISPFMNTDLIKVFTGIRRAGKSVMLELVKNELKESAHSEAVLPNHWRLYDFCSLMILEIVLLS
mgnify:CR=1 FL=1